ncbi:efflux RND transporter periplasmic adaptor subunit [Reyranella sp.]|uniref:efflux RND transporter periplasmic adaptor subunit n=1 Tax=Reyranella sp. TaxID=1929291 RepID=UPI003D11EED0
MRIPLKLLPVLAAAFALLAAALVLSSRPAANAPAAASPSSATQFAARPAGDGVDGAIVALGRVEPASRVLRLAGPSGNDAGRIAVLSVAEGQRVTRGQALGILDTEPRLAAAQAQADANVATKTAHLALKLAELDNAEQSLGAALEQQVAERDRAQWDFDRLSHLNKAGLYSDPALIDKRLALLSANRKLRSSTLALERIQQRDANGHRLEEAVARAELRAAEAAAEKARTDRALSHFRAPMDGTILRLHARLGQQLGTEGFAEMGDVSAMVVRAEVFEADIAAVALDQPATVTSRSLATPLHGTVDRIGVAVGTQGIIREDPAAVLDSRVVEVIVKLDPVSSARVSALTNLQVRVAIERTAPGAGRSPQQLSRVD